MPAQRLDGISVAGDKHEFDPERWTTAASGQAGANGNGTAAIPPSHLPKRYPETGIDVLIVGAGMGGLMTALECWRKGHNVVRILERNDGPVYTGDIIVMQPSAMSIMREWPDMMADLEAEQVEADVNYETHSGRHIHGPTVPEYNEPEHIKARPGWPYVAPAQIRRKFFRMLLRQVARLGLRVEYSQRVVDYVEDAAGGKGGVVLEAGGEVLYADVVVAADGLRSRSEMLIAGEHSPTKSSGMSIYRTAYPRELAMRDPVVRARWGDARPTWEYWLGPGMYMGVFLGTDVISWGFTPRDAAAGGSAATESWDPATDPEEVASVIQRVPGWDPAILALVRTAPRGAIVHWPLLWRDLRRDWASPGGRVVQVGDSAHTFVPASGNGATQALEDAITLAACLELAVSSSASPAAKSNSDKVPLAVKTYNLLRYQRVSCAQKMSFVNSQLKTETDWAAIWREPWRVRTRFPRWIFSHDPEKYARERFADAVAHLERGAPFENTNFPPGHRFVPWTIEEVYRDIEAGKRVEDLLDGDWS